MMAYLQYIRTMLIKDTHIIEIKNHIDMSVEAAEPRVECKKSASRMAGKIRVCKIRNKAS